MVPGSGGGWTFGNWTPGRIGFALVVLLTAGLWAGGAVRLSGEPTGASVEGVVLRLVQGNVAQKDKWRPELGPAHMREYLKMSTARDATVRSDGLAANRKPSHVIWPETSIPYFLNEQPQLVRDLSVAAPVGGTLIAGAPRIERGERLRLYNSLYAIAAGAGIVATYDKAHLVPFGEYVPFKEFLPLLPVVETFQGFDPGPGPRTLKLPGLPAISPLICYEVVFPGEVAVRDAAVSPMPRFLLNLTNDAWYGHSSGPYQHFAIARFRAVEEGLPMVRVANNGISGVVDAHGRVIAMLGMEVKGTIDSILPPSLSELTLFAKFGIQPFFLITFVLLLISYISRHPRI
jgi:apolipoprotein N-acyltransferase